jgi:hypothetical protein
MPAVYMSRKVEFVESGAKPLALGEETFRIEYPGKAFTDDGVIFAAALASLKLEVRKFMQKNKFRCCIVLAEDDSIFMEHDGSENSSKEPPSGGFSIDTVEVSSS